MRRPLTAAVLIAALCAALPALPATDSDALPEAVVAALPGIVGVTVREVETVPVFRDGRFEMERVEGSGAGSGVVVDAAGLILTNAHVVGGSSEVRVRLQGGEERSARVLSVDEASDLALLRVIGAAGLRPIEFAGSDLPPPGTSGFVIGNRDDAGPSLSWARIGSHRRVRVGVRGIEFWSEVVGAVGPGLSGGAFLDAGGRLLGIPGLRIQYSAPVPRGARGAGLFIPAAHAHRSLGRMMEAPVAIWPFLGLVLDDALLAAARADSGYDAGRVVVRSVVPGSPAADAGLRPGDRLTAIGARRPADNFEALDAVLNLAPGGTVILAVERERAALEIAVSVGTRPPDPRPDPLDDFSLHTGVRLAERAGPQGGRAAIVATGISARLQSEMLPFEAELFDAGPALASLLPGLDALNGASKRLPIEGAGDLGALMARAFVGEQFVAFAHWVEGGRTSDRAYVSRKIYPVVL